MVDCLLAVLEHPPTELARVGALFPMDVLLVLVQHDVGHEGFAALIARLADAEVDGRHVLPQGEPHLADAPDELLAAVLAHTLALGPATAVDK